MEEEGSLVRLNDLGDGVVLTGLEVAGGELVGVWEVLCVEKRAERSCSMNSFALLVR